MHLRPVLTATGTITAMALAVTTAVGVGLLRPTPAEAADSAFYVDPDTNAARWVAANPGDPRTAPFLVLSEDRISAPGFEWHPHRGIETVTVVLDGGELVVDVDEALLFTLTGWAVPVYAGEASPALLADLHALD